MAGISVVHDGRVFENTGHVGILNVICTTFEAYVEASGCRATARPFKGSISRSITCNSQTPLMGAKRMLAAIFECHRNLDRILGPWLLDTLCFHPNIGFQLLLDDNFDVNSEVRSATGGNAQGEHKKCSGLWNCRAHLSSNIQIANSALAREKPRALRLVLAVNLGAQSRACRKCSTRCRVEGDGLRRARAGRRPHRQRRWVRA